VHGDLDIGQSDVVALKVREELARRRLSRQWLADEARISISTLEKALAGRRPFTLGTVIRLEEALKVELRAAPAPAATPTQNSGFAPEEMGAYARPAVRWLEGTYLTLRPSFEEPSAIYAYRTTIAWDEESSHLRFAESARVDAEFTQKGFVSFPHLSGHIYLVTMFEGQYRLILLGRPSAKGAMCGVLTSLVSGAGSQLTPASAPITLIPANDGAPTLGLIRPGMDCYGEYRQRIDQIPARGYALFPT
jgi:transcriptional regulator with XRE-family HTH domain